MTRSEAFAMRPIALILGLALVASCTGYGAGITFGEGGAVVTPSATGQIDRATVTITGEAG